MSAVSSSATHATPVGQRVFPEAVSGLENGMGWEAEALLPMCHSANLNEEPNTQELRETCSSHPDTTHE